LDVHSEHNARPRSEEGGGGIISSTRDEVGISNKMQWRRLYVETRLRPHPTPRVSRSSPVGRPGPLTLSSLASQPLLHSDCSTIVDGEKRDGITAVDASAVVIIDPPPSSSRRRSHAPSSDSTRRSHRDESRDSEPSSERFARSSSSGNERSCDCRHHDDGDDRFLSKIRDEMRRLESIGVCRVPPRGDGVSSSTIAIPSAGGVANDAVESRCGPSTEVTRVVDSIDDRLLDGESTIDELRIQLRIMKRVVHAEESEIADLKRRLVDVRREADEDVIEMDRRVESETSDLRRRLDDAQRANGEMARAHSNAIEEIKREHERSLEVAASENYALREELRRCQDRTEEVIRSLRDKNEDLKMMLDVAERDAELRRWECVDMKTRYEDAMKKCGNEIDDMKEDLRLLVLDKTQLESENIALKVETDDLSRERDRYLHSLNDKDRLEGENISLKIELDDITQERNRYLRSLDDLDHLERENSLLTIELDEITHERNRYLHSLDDKNRLERDYTSLKIELDDVTQERDQVEAMLDDKTNKLEVANDEISNLSSRIENLMLSYEREIMRLKDEIDVMKPRLTLMGELTNSFEVALDEKDEVTLSFERLRNDLRSTLLEKEDVVDRCSKLEMECTRLLAITNSESHMAATLRKERDSLSGMVEIYLNEIQNLRMTTAEVSRERDDLKDELICVLETAASALD
jgi:chromosome segregation ATPase